MSKNLFYKILGVEEAQGERVVLMLVMGFFMGIFLATFTVASETLFLAQFDEQTELPFAFLASGVVGLIATYFFNFFQGRIKYKSLVLIFLFLMTVLVLFILAGFYYEVNSRRVVFAAFVCAGPFLAISMLIFWGTFGRIFNLRESKQIIGNIDTGTLVASILALFSIPFILRLLPQTYDLYIISTVSVVVILITLVVISSKYPFVEGVAEEDKGKPRRYSYRQLFKNGYTKVMAAFVIVSAISVAFIDFTFLNVTSQQFPVERDLAGFLAYFEGTIVIFSFLFQTFVTDRIISMYGLKVSLLINPILLGLLTAGALLVGTIFGFSAEASNFIIFFLVISMSKLFLDALKDALDGPSFKLYFLPISANIKFDVQTKVEGVINVFAGLIAGSLILIMSRINIFNLLSLVLLVIPLVVAWYFLTRKMHGKYRDTLKDTLEDNRKQTAVSLKADFSNDLILEDQISDASPDKQLLILNLMERIEPMSFEKNIGKYTKSNYGNLQDFAKKKSSDIEIDIDKQYKAFLKDENFISETRRLAANALKSADASDLLSLDPRQLSALAKSPDPKIREFIARILRKVNSAETHFIALELLRDTHPQVKIAAINTTRILKIEDSWPVLVDLLGTTTYFTFASAALVNMGEKAIPYLEKAFNKSGQLTIIQLRILHIYGRIGGTMAMNALWDKIDFPDKTMLYYIMNGFRYNNYRVDEEKLIKVKGLLETALGVTLWNLAAYDEISDVPQNEPLREALKEEINENYDRVYLLLGLIYDPNSINLVRKNIESETAEGYAFGLELLDIFIDPDVKPMLFPILDDISVAEKLNLLQDYFPREKFSEIDSLRQIINRNYNQISRWTKACAVFSMSNLNVEMVTNTIIAQLFNPDPLLREISAWLIYTKNREEYQGVENRLKRNIRNELDEILLNSKFLDQVTPQMLLRFEKVLYLKKLPLFNQISGEILASLVDIIESQVKEPGEYIFHDLNQWDKDLLILVEGKVIVEGDKGHYHEMAKDEVLGDFLFQDLEDKKINAFVLEKSVVFSIGKGRLYELMSKSDLLTRQFIANWENLKKTEN